MRFLSILFCLLIISLCCSCNSDPADNSLQGALADPANNSSGVLADKDHGISLVPCEPPVADAQYPLASMVAYRYKEYTMMVRPQGIVLGTKTPGSEKKESAVTLKGNYAHLNIDNKKHTVANDDRFRVRIEDGKHDLFCFISRSYHETIKIPAACLAKEIEVKNGTATKSIQMTKAAIAYASPWGLHKNDDTKKVVLDFFLINTDIAPNGNKVRVTIDDLAVFILDKWQAQYIEGLGLGEHKVQLELLDRSDKVIYGPISNKFILTEEPPNS